MTFCCKWRGREVSFGEQVAHLHLQVSQVPGDPAEQANEDNEGSWEDKEIPEADGGKDPDEEENEACSIQEGGDEENRQTAAKVGDIIHDRSSSLRLCLQQIIHSFASLSVWHVENVKEWNKLRWNAPSLLSATCESEVGLMSRKS